jgi:hypothetical protein
MQIAVKQTNLRRRRRRRDRVIGVGSVRRL